MLPDLDKIDWASTADAYGPATDVPELLRGMLDPARSAEAFSSFDGAVNHQGWVTPAAEHCLPWLVAALDEPGAPIAELTRRLADLAVLGNHHSWIGRRMVVEYEPALYEPIVVAHPAFVRFLEDKDPAVRANAALALAVLRTRADVALPAVRAALEREKKVEVKASLLLALGVLGDADDVARVDAASGGKRVAAAVRIAAACARIWLRPTSISDDDILELLATAATRGKNAKGLPWADGELHTLSSAVAMQALAEHVDGERVVGLLEVVDDKMAPGIVSMLVQRAFPKGGPSYWSPTELSGAQQAALRLATKFELPYATKDRLVEAGIPSKPHSMRVFLGLETGGVLDREIHVAGRAQPLWRAMRAAMREEIDVAQLAAAAADQFGLQDTVAAIGELFGPVDKAHYADIVLIMPKSGFADADAPYASSTQEVMAGLVANLLRPYREALRPVAEAALEPLVTNEHPPQVQSVAWLSALARLGPLDAKWDPLVRKLVDGAPATRSALMLGEVLRAIGVERRNAIVLAHPLVKFSGSTTTEGGRVVFSYEAARASETWWYLWTCPTPEALEAVVGAVRTWSTLPPLPDPKDVPKGCYVSPHGPFPFRRAQETFAHWDAKHVRDALDSLAGDTDVDREIVRRLQTLVPQ